MTQYFQCIIADPPWGAFGDKLQMSSVKRGAAANYNTMTTQEIMNLPVQSIADPKGCVLALWTPCSLLQDGLDVMRAWGFKHKQVYVWVKNKKAPFKELLKEINKSLLEEEELTKKTVKHIISNIGETCKDQLQQVLQFGMGHLFRQTHEIALIGINNNGIYSQLMNKSQRSVSFATNLKHSMKPDNLHQALETMFPQSKKIELFARQARTGWITFGNQCETTLNIDIRNSLADLIC